VPNDLFFAGDLGQRIFQQPFSWRALGVDVRGRSRTLRINYRTSHQIRTHADLLQVTGGEVAVEGVLISLDALVGEGAEGRVEPADEGLDGAVLAHRLLSFMSVVAPPRPLSRPYP
jgi:hypothetical protein